MGNGLKPRSSNIMTINNFGKLIFLEEMIANDENREQVRIFQRGFTYTTHRERYKQPWKSEDLIDQIIRKFVESQQFEYLRNSDNRNIKI